MRSFPFRSAKVVEPLTGNISYDRPVDANEYREMFNSLVSNGVLANPSTNLQVHALGNDMSVIVAKGKGYVKGNVFWETQERKLILDSATGQPRIDRVVVRFNDDADVRKVDLYIVKGTPSSVPQAPALTRTSTIYELCLAEIYINASVTQITNSSITDKRKDNSLCGIVHGLIDQLDTTTLNQQYEAWLAETREQGYSDLATSKQGFDTFIAERENQIQQVLDTRKFSTVKTISVDNSLWQPSNGLFTALVSVEGLKASDLAQVNLATGIPNKEFRKLQDANIRVLNQLEGAITLEAKIKPATFNILVGIFY